MILSQIWVAAFVNGEFRIGEALPDSPFVWELDQRRLEVRYQEIQAPNSFAAACEFDKDQPPGEFKRLVFNWTCRLGEFSVRIYRNEEMASRSRDEFTKTIDVARYI